MDNDIIVTLPRHLAVRMANVLRLSGDPAIDAGDYEKIADELEAALDATERGASCPECHGKGRLLYGYKLQRSVPCPECSGSGRIPLACCAHSHGGPDGHDYGCPTRIAVR